MAREGEGQEEWIVKNTFLELQDPSKREEGMKRSNSTSDLSTYSSAPSATLQELKDWSDRSSRNNSESGSQCSTPKTASASGDICTGEEPDNPQPPTLDAEELYTKLMALGGKRSASAEMILAQETSEIRKYIPFDKQGNLTSIGSLMHFKEEVSTQCKPCIFWAKGRCGKGSMCFHCHYKHPNVEGKRLRASKATRERRAKLLAKGKATDVNDGGSQGSACDSSSVQSNASGAVTNSDNKSFKSGTVISL
eukprot:gnl/MRDRNA2_/MRDRNA2_14958_c0_seq1.p1 gnl/MRDRNA2_/MRDRNA2_14958_c0~~gnl/MRDRNA2_/MRDRNA2_14958_c0_seq1.p1  ORF type:complete len:251 (-),score=50.03 gnl/MRDRNA2_/MRDRNA2_14958_c0_seq1:828-1580(-)